MKKNITLLAIATLLLAGCRDHSGLSGLLTDYDERISQVELICQQLNTNITSIQTIVEAAEGGDYITSITPIMSEGREIGYTITFKNHEPITIYHGGNGVNGLDGGGDGNSPIVGVRKDTDGVYYWTLNGEWMLNDEGQRIRVVGLNGNDGNTGKDGVDGKDGADGQDGITPQLKIEDGYWYVSYNGGTSWTQLGKAVGENGQDGTQGEKGDKGDQGDKGDTGDSMFQSVTQDNNYVYFTLADGNTISISKNGGDSSSVTPVEIVDGAIMAEFSVSATKKVYFSQGNLIYDTIGTHLCADGTTKKGTWKFAENQWEQGDVFLYGNSGYENEVKIYDKNKQHSEKDNVAFLSYESKDIKNTYYDWGTYNAIINGGNNPGEFRLLSKSEYEYLLKKRPHAEKLQGIININDGIVCAYFLPDNSDTTILIPQNLYTEKQIYDGSYPNIKGLLSIGAVIIPRNSIGDSSSNGYSYWLGSYNYQKTYSGITSYYAYGMTMGMTILDLSLHDMLKIYATSGTGIVYNSVRLVKDVN